MEATLQEKAQQAAQVAAQAAQAANDAALIEKLESVKHTRDFLTLCDGNKFQSEKLKAAWISRRGFAAWSELVGRSH